MLVIAQEMAIANDISVVGRAGMGEGVMAVERHGTLFLESAQILRNIDDWTTLNVHIQ